MVQCCFRIRVFSQLCVSWTLNNQLLRGIQLANSNLKSNQNIRKPKLESKQVIIAASQERLKANQELSSQYSKLFHNDVFLSTSIIERNYTVNYTGVSLDLKKNNRYVKYLHT